MNVDLDNARRAYEAAKTVHTWFNPGQYPSHAQLQSLAAVGLSTAKAAYETALLADAQARFDDMGVVIGETLCCDIMPSKKPYVIDRLEAMPDRGMVRCHHNGGFANYDVIRPYVAPVVKEMVLESSSGFTWTAGQGYKPTHRLTLSGITPVDLDGMTGRITGQFTVEKL